MSTFCGLMQEIPGISVDRFDGENKNSSAFFLSHCHSDHMEGLNNDFFRHLDINDKYIYCSPISKLFLEARTGYKTNIIDIAINKKVLVRYKHNDCDNDVLVTCISSGHCPGSIMFLFKKDSDLILYTGDFRINPLDYKKIARLHFYENDKKLRKKITAMYLDTTFLNPEFASFPTREESMDVMRKAVVDWLDKSSKNVVVLECSALYGSEFLYMELAKSLNMPIHVKDRVYESYCRISELAPHITNNASSTRVHACMEKTYRSGLTCCQSVLQENILTIVPSTLWWKGKNTSVIREWNGVRENTLNICYSMHASFDELKAFIQYFRSKDLYPCVVPKEIEPYRNFIRIFRDVLNEIDKKIEEEKVNSDRNREKYTFQSCDDENVVQTWYKYY